MGNPRKFTTFALKFVTFLLSIFIPRRAVDVFNKENKTKINRIFGSGVLPDKILLVRIIEYNK